VRDYLPAVLMTYYKLFNLRDMDIGDDVHGSQHLRGLEFRLPKSIVFLVRFLCIAGYCLVSSLLFSAFVSIELRILCAVVHTEGTSFL
jgi:hypothetical protein